jgi:hypothetical protein
MLLMPTPFMHLDVAQEMLGLGCNGRLAQPLLVAERPAFYLGHVAPDVNAISTVSRAASHFYDLPPIPEYEAYEMMLQQYPQLRHNADLPPAQAVFVAGYMAHLYLDLVWLRQIVLPYFYHGEEMGSRAYRRMIHFALLTYLDMQAETRLAPETRTVLAAAVPQHWLPFIADDILIRWRDVLLPQLVPDAASRTVEIYAGRLGIPVAEFGRQMRDEEWLAQNLFRNVPVDTISEILQNSIDTACDLVQEYLS